MRDRLARLDRALMRGTNAIAGRRVDRGFRWVSRAADHGMLWLALAAVLGSRSGRSRRAAARGLAGLGIASAVVNLVGKPVFPRRRPAVALASPQRRLPRRPESSSFPSGHAASAAAFVTGVALERPRAAVAVAPLAGAVAYSRVHVAVHWPSDVAAGALVGIGAGLVTTWLSPVTEEEPAHEPPAVSAPSLGAGQWLLFVVNPLAGRGSLATTVRRCWPRARILAPHGGREDLGARLRAALADEAPDALGVAGGDGTVATVAGAAVEAGVPLVVVAGGTLNHFVRDLGCAVPPVTATARGLGARVDLASVTVDGGPARWFVNTASLGVYPQLVRERALLRVRWGRWAAAVLALARVARVASPLRLRVDGRCRDVWTVFVGNNVYLPSGSAPAYRPSMASGVLDVRLVLAEGRLPRLRLVAAALTGSLHRTRAYQRHRVASVRIDSAEPVRLATDGELGPYGQTFTFRSEHGALRVYRDPGGSRSPTN